MDSSMDGEEKIKMDSSMDGEEKREKEHQYWRDSVIMPTSTKENPALGFLRVFSIPFYFSFT